MLKVGGAERYRLELGHRRHRPDHQPARGDRRRRPHLRVRARRGRRARARSAATARSSRAYDYDLDGDRTQRTLAAGAPEAATYDAGGKLASRGGVAYTLRRRRLPGRARRATRSPTTAAATCARRPSAARRSPTPTTRSAAGSPASQGAQLTQLRLRRPRLAVADLRRAGSGRHARPLPLRAARATSTRSCAGARSFYVGHRPGRLAARGRGRRRSRRQAPRVRRLRRRDRPRPGLLPADRLRRRAARPGDEARPLRPARLRAARPGASPRATRPASTAPRATLYGYASNSPASFRDLDGTAVGGRLGLRRIRRRREHLPRPERHLGPEQAVLRRCLLRAAASASAAASRPTCSRRVRRTSTFTGIAEVSAKVPFVGGEGRRRVGPDLRDGEVQGRRQPRPAPGRRRQREHAERRRSRGPRRAWGRRSWAVRPGSRSRARPASRPACRRRARSRRPRNKADSHTIFRRIALGPDAPGDRRFAAMRIRNLTAAGLLGALLLPAAAGAATKPVFRGPPPKGQLKGVKGPAFDSSFYPSRVTIAAGDKIKLTHARLRRHDLRAQGPEGPGVRGAEPRRPRLRRQGRRRRRHVVQRPAGVRAQPGRDHARRAATVIDGSKVVGSGLALDGPPKPWVVKFPKAGTYVLRSALQPGVTLTVKVTKKAPEGRLAARSRQQAAARRRAASTSAGSRASCAPTPSSPTGS